MSGKRREQPNSLLVEGKDDEHVFYSLFTYYNIPDVFEIKNKEGVDRLLETLDVELDRSGLQRLGIVIDADTNLATRWQSLSSILTNVGYTSIPQFPDTQGTIVQEPGHPRVGIWLMPNNTISGMLEDFVSFLVPESANTLWQLAQQAVQNIPEQERRFPAIHTTKAYLHTWLSWQEEPGEPLGLAITKRYFDANAPHAQQLISWIRRLFDLETP